MGCQIRLNRVYHGNGVYLVDYLVHSGGLGAES